MGTMFLALVLCQSPKPVVPQDPKPLTPVALVPVTYRAAQGHTHTCNRCGTTWDHASNPSHDCANCGAEQRVQDTSPKMIRISGAGAMQLSGSGCANGNCAMPQQSRPRIFGRIFR